MTRDFKTDEKLNDDTKKGRVVKTYNSYYYVESDGRERTVCSLRGRFKKERFSLLVGDEVFFTKTGSDVGVIEKIVPRETMMTRPRVANVNHAALVFAAADPDINQALLDQFLVLAEHSRLQTTICINKADLGESSAILRLAEKYRQIGYETLLVSTKDLRGITELKKILKNKISVFSGPSGVGKSTILNVIEPNLNLQTGQVSKKIGRGKHTTRFAELLNLSDGGFVVDTPGFSFAEFDDIKETELMYYFPEFLPLISGCKFNTCLHLKEPDCSVKEGIEKGLVFSERYDSYVDILNKIREKRKVY
jgi:ribosome biogenesis GTPase